MRLFGCFAFARASRRLRRAARRSEAWELGDASTTRHRDGDTPAWRATELASKALFVPRGTLNTFNVEPSCAYTATVTIDGWSSSDIKDDATDEEATEDTSSSRSPKED